MAPPRVALFLLLIAAAPFDSEACNPVAGDCAGAEGLELITGSQSMPVPSGFAQISAGGTLAQHEEKGAALLDQLQLTPEQLQLLSQPGALEALRAANLASAHSAQAASRGRDDEQWLEKGGVISLPTATAGEPAFKATFNATRNGINMLNKWSSNMMKFYKETPLTSRNWCNHFQGGAVVVYPGAMLYDRLIMLSSSSGENSMGGWTDGSAQCDTSNGNFAFGSWKTHISPDLSVIQFKYDDVYLMCKAENYGSTTAEAMQEFEAMLSKPFFASATFKCCTSTKCVMQKWCSNMTSPQCAVG